MIFTKNLIKHINLDDLFQNRLSYISYIHNEQTFKSINDLYKQYDIFCEKVKYQTYFSEDMFLKYFRNMSKPSSQIDGSYCLYDFDENKVYLRRFIPSHLHLDWIDNILSVNITKFKKYKFEISFDFNKH